MTTHIIFLTLALILFILLGIASLILYREILYKIGEIKSSTYEKINLIREVLCEISEEMNTTGDTLTTLASLMSEYKGTIDSVKTTLDKIPFSARQAPRTKKKQDSTSM